MAAAGTARADSCDTERLEVAVCQKGMRLLINGRPVTPEVFASRLTELHEIISKPMLETYDFVRREKVVTSSHYAATCGLNCTTASMRLRRGIELGFLRRSRPDLTGTGRHGGNEYEYRLVTNRDVQGS